MKFILSIILIIVFSFGLMYFLPLPWWSPAVVAALVGLQLRLSAFSSFLAGFVAGGLLWLGHASFINSANDGLLLGKISAVLSMSTTILWVAVFGFGALLSGFGAMTGSLFRSAFIGDLAAGHRRRRR
jgi:hypothetical protein